jgi:hypothetical protein
MSLRTAALSLSTLVLSLSLHAADAEAEHAKATGTVSAVNAEKKSFTLVEDGSGKSESYRPFYAGGDKEKMADKIPHLTVGEHVVVVYTVKEGRRALTITDVAK